MSAHGKWNVTIDTPMGSREAVLDLVVEPGSGVLSGSLSDGEHVVALTDGRVDGSRLTWSAKITKPMRMSFKFTATVEADRIEGNAKAMLGSASFRGKRA